MPSGIAPWRGRLSVAAVNGAEATVVSGEPQALDELVAACEAAGLRARVLPVDYASHSVQVEQIRDETGYAVPNSPIEEFGILMHQIKD